MVGATVLNWVFIPFPLPPPPPPTLLPSRGHLKTKWAWARAYKQIGRKLRFFMLKQTNKGFHVRTTIRAALPTFLLHKLPVFIALSFFGPNDAS